MDAHLDQTRTEREQVRAKAQSKAFWSRIDKRET
jgi:hypothetical protein